MNKDIKYFGIDISQKVFDVTDSDGNYYQLAYYLLETGFKVSVENPLSVKRYIQMRLSKLKTDKSDSKLICEYAMHVELKLWKGNSKEVQECLQITRALWVYTKQRTMLKNKLHGESVLGEPSKIVVRSLKRSLKQLDKTMQALEERLLFLVKDTHKDLFTRITTIPGIGRKTAIMLIVLTGGFERFSSASELCSYAGLTPMIRQSGSSVKGRPRISKMGNQKLRNLLCAVLQLANTTKHAEIFMSE